MIISIFFCLLATVVQSIGAREASLMKHSIISLHDFEKMHPESLSEAVPREIEKVMSMILPDLNANGTEFGAAQSTSALTSGLWEEQQRFTWQKLLHSSDPTRNGSRELEDQGGLYVDRASDSNSRCHPFVFCNSDVNLSGSKRRSFISSMLGYELSEVDRAIFSNDNLSCFLALATTFELEKIMDNNANIQIDVFPLTPLMKIQNWSYTIDAIRNQVSSADPIEVMAELIIPPDEVIDAYKALDILHYATDKLAMASLSEKTQSNNDPVGLRGRLLQDSSDLASCHGLEIEIDMIFAESSSVSFNIFTDSTLSPERNVECGLSFMAALSVHPSICSVSTDERPVTLNDMAQQIVQTENLSHVGQPHLSPHVFPYFDAGLTASNQIIGLSDTGIREDSCYFSDENGPVTRSAVSCTSVLSVIFHSLSTYVTSNLFLVFIPLPRDCWTICTYSSSLNDYFAVLSWPGP